MSTAPTLEQRVAALETAERLDTLSPTYLTVNPDGSIGATFTGDIRARSIVDTPTNGNVFKLGADGSLSLKGLINALGLILPTGIGLPGLQNRITWTRKSDGAMVADINSYVDSDPGGATSLGLGAAAPDHPGTTSGIAFRANQAGGNGNNNATISVGGRYATLLDDQGASSFLQLEGKHRWMDHGPYAIGVNLAPGFFGQIGTIPAAPSPNYQVIGSLYDTGSLSACTWGYGGVSSGFGIPIYMRNPLGIATTGSFIAILRELAS